MGTRLWRKRNTLRRWFQRLSRILLRKAPKEPWGKQEYVLRAKKELGADSYCGLRATNLEEVRIGEERGARLEQDTSFRCPGGDRKDAGGAKKVPPTV